MRILIYNSENRFIKTILSKIKGEKTVFFGKDLEDITSFKPDIVYCYNNIHIPDKCIEKNIRCIHIFDILKFRLNFNNKLVSEVLIKPFNIEDINKISDNDLMSFSMLEDVSEKLSDFNTPGNHLMVNPGKVKVSDILKYYRLSPEELKNGIDRSSIPDNGYDLKNIEKYFKEDFSQKVNIYLPTYYRLEKTKQSLESIIEASKESKYDVKIYIGDNNTDEDEMQAWLSLLENDLVSVTFGDENIGKAGMVNVLSKNSRDCDYIFSIDSDMVTNDSCENFIDEMIFHLTRIQNCGLISSQQAGCCQHWWGQTVDLIKVDGLEVGYSDQGVGIAGGCICMKQEDWVKVGMYKENHDVYTGDDGILTHKVRKILGKEVYVTKNCSLDHPFPGEDEKEYSEWKMESWKRDGLQFLKEDFKGTNRKGFYDK